MKSRPFVERVQPPIETPVIDGILMVAILGSGAVASYFAMPILWVITPVMAGFVRYAARTALSPAPEVEEEVVASEFPPDVQRLVDATTHQLHPGEARQLLAHVVRQARPLFAERESAFDARTEADTRFEISELVGAACETALELARLDAAAPGERGEHALVARYDRARDILVKQLRDAATASSEMYASNVEHGTPASDRVGELAGEVRADARARQAALGEISELS